MSILVKGMMEVTGRVDVKVFVSKMVGEVMLVKTVTAALVVLVMDVKVL